MVNKNAVKLIKTDRNTYIIIGKRYTPGTAIGVKDPEGEAVKATMASNEVAVEVSRTGLEKLLGLVKDT
jgi:hypothetical protein